MEPLDPRTQSETMQIAQDVGVRRGASTAKDAATAAQELYEQIHQPDMTFALFYCSPDYDLDELAKELHARFGDANLIGCTSAGEITPSGYLQGSITGVSISSEDFHAVTYAIDELSGFEVSQGQVVAEQALSDITSHGTRPDGDNTFGFLLIDGLCKREELVVSSIHRSLGNIQLFGGSAGDGVDFAQTYVYHDGQFRSEVAVLTLVQTSRPFVVFKTQHFVPGDGKMVVTGANPAERTVTEINGVAAGREYARMVGIEVEELDPMVFASHPVVVRIGGEYFVRSILRVNEDESITFACAVDEGIVLTVAHGVDMVDNLRDTFADLRGKIGEPEIVFGCDCLFRAVEMDQKGLREDISEIMRENNVIGLATYGEQYNAMHVNQTFTGVAIGSVAP